MSSAALFERLAPRYDELWTDTPVGRAQRDAVWRVIDQLFRAGDCVLDIGCGTGEDAVHLSARGVLVHAVDASPAMVARARERGVAAEVMRAEDLGRAALAGRAEALRRLKPTPLTGALFFSQDCRGVAVGGFAGGDPAGQ